MEDAAGGQRQHPHAARRQLARLLVRQADERRLGRVVAHRATAFTSPDAGDVQDDALLPAARRIDGGRRKRAALTGRGFQERQREAGGANGGPQVPVQRC